MAKRESKGQKVKTFKTHIPQTDLTNREEIVSVYFKADHGAFCIYPPEHIAAYVNSNADGDRQGFSVHSGRDEPLSMRHKIMDELIQSFESTLKAYKHLMRSEARKKVIDFTIKYNLAGGLGVGGSAHRDDISFAGSPTLHLDYKVWWKVGDGLFYYRSDNDKHMTYYGKTAKDVIEWTAEREEFFHNMKGALEAIIRRLAEFKAALNVDVDRAMLGFSSTRALPPPRQEGDG